MARSNYSYAKRQKELARQKKQEEKRLKKQQRREAGDDHSSPTEVLDTPPQIGREDNSY